MEASTEPPVQRKRAQKKTTKKATAKAEATEKSQSKGGKQLPRLSKESKSHEANATLRLQVLLGLFRIYLRPDGRFGPQTERAVIEFQQLVGLPQDGVVDEKTWEQLLYFKLA